MNNEFENVKRTIALTRALACAVTRDELQLYYQPVFTLAEEKLKLRGAEILLRWNHPIFGVVQPDQFISISEHFSYIQRIGMYVIERACRKLSIWASCIDAQHLSLSVNVSPLQFIDPDFGRNVIGLVQEYSLQPGRLKFEITESIFIKDRDIVSVVKTMNLLVAAGITFSLDDFGTGYSSFSYLSKLPLAELKMDRRFIENIERKNEQAIPQMIVGISKAMNLELVAEGIENQYQKDILIQMGATNFQGYLFGRPMPLDTFTETYIKGCSAVMNDSIHIVKLV